MKILSKKGDKSNLSSSSQYFARVVRFSCLGRNRVKYGETFKFCFGLFCKKRLFEISEVEITRVNCICKRPNNRLATFSQSKEITNINKTE